MTEKGSRKDKNQNIQVFVRLRPLNQRERDIKSLGVVEVLHDREVVVRQSQQTSHTKKFTFDRAFGPYAKQVEVYQEVVSPLIEEVLAGYNCTVFAYGQTGTGKTHTMVGENTSVDANWQDDPLAGIIPRALSQLFDELRISNTEYTVRVSYLELYNEELFDMLSTSKDNQSKLRIYEDATRKGSNIVDGLEEITVNNKNEVYKIMSKGQERKKVAPTLMNAQSSRSHTVFTIVVHMKENSPEGEELVKIGKLNLVDLAGSENISKAGSDNPQKKERARESVNINQSLLTLGRVITALVERHPHIPYRESKLTRILQESLGGRTKTSIIATISPGHKDLEETMSTLEYAHRAKNIQNKPEVNQKMTKKAILKEYVEEIDRLKRDLQAARDKNGIYLAEDTYTELNLKQEEQRKEIQELLLKIRAMEEKRDKLESMFSSLHQSLESRASELQAARNKLSTTKAQLADTHQMLCTTKSQYEEQVHLVEKQLATEQALSGQAKQLLATTEVATTHVHYLHDSVDRRRQVECRNLQVTRDYREQSSKQREETAARAAHFTEQLVRELNLLHSQLVNVSTTSSEQLTNNKSVLEQLVQNIVHTLDEIKSLTSASESALHSATDCHRSSIQSSIESHSRAVRSTLSSLLETLAGTVQAAEEQRLPDNVDNYVRQWYTSAVERVCSLVSSHSAFTARVCASERARGEWSRTHYDARRAAVERKATDIRDIVAEIETDKAELESRLSRHQADMESERKETEIRLQQWAEEERRCLEERIQARVKTETEYLEHKLKKKTAELESERSYLESRIARHLQSQQKLLEEFTQELTLLEGERSEEERQRGKALDTVTNYTKEFDIDATSIRVDMEALTQNVVEVVRHMYAELLGTLHRAKDTLQRDAAAVEQCDAAAAAQLLAETASAHARLLHQHRENVASLLHSIETNNTSTICTLSSVAASADTLLTGTQHHVASHGACVSDMTSQAETFASHIREDLEKHRHLEGKYLAEEYNVYQPTGATPQRTEYRYPRSLAATSPHEKILARFRETMRQNTTNEDDCIVIEDGESNISSGESSLSEDSPSFVAPSTPAPRAHHQHNGIVKCTSESNIYDIKRGREQQGKENADREVNGYKKPSKLRAPSARKTPLHERNGVN